MTTQTPRYIIIGGVAGGATAAARIRRLTEKAEIILIEKGAHISYANCGLPYYIGGVIADRDRLFVQTPESFGRRFNIDVRTLSEVIAIDPSSRQVTVPVFLSGVPPLSSSSATVIELLRDTGSWSVSISVTGSVRVLRTASFHPML